MRHVIKEFFRRERFSPTYFGLLVNPFYFARRGLARELRPLLAEFRGTVLDVGCGQKPYLAWISGESYVGVDIDSEVTRAIGAADVLYDGKRLPFPDASFDHVLCSQVLEHVFYPDEFISELARVLKSEGTLVLTTPFAWDEHEQPFDYARYSSFGLRALLNRSGFSVEVHRKTVSDGRAIVQLTSAWLYKVTRTRKRLINALVQILLLAPCNLIGGVIAAVLPANDNFYLDNVVVARKRHD